MSLRARHTQVQPSMATTYSRGSRSQVPRHQPRSDLEAGTFSSASLTHGHSNPNFSLSSSGDRRRHQQYESNHWSAQGNVYPKGDDYSSLAVGYHPSNPMESCYPISVTSSSDIMDVTYDLAAGEVYARPGPLSTAITQPGIQAECFSQDFMMSNEYLAVDYTQFNCMDDWPNRPLTPPSEAYLEATLNHLGGSSYDDVCTTSQDLTICEPLGPSNFHPYSGSQHNTVHPRPLRSASERSPVVSNDNDDSDSRSPKDDNGDKAKARNDPLYDAKPGADGLYHCPLAREFKCTHKPTKRKCIYAKYLDSHLRPYRCKYAEPGNDCMETRFSSNACLFRHEREAHGKHNHGLNPYLCDYPGCERANPGDGFPRRWNQRDHMKRVHNWIEDDSTSPPNDRHATTDSSKRRRGPGGPASVQMRRSGSSYARTQAINGACSRDSGLAVNVSRYQTQASFVNSMQACNVMAYPVSVDAIQFSQTSLPRESRYSQAYNGGYYQAVC